MKGHFHRTTFIAGAPLSHCVSPGSLNWNALSIFHNTNAFVPGMCGAGSGSCGVGPSSILYRICFRLHRNATTAAPVPHSYDLKQNIFQTMIARKEKQTYIELQAKNQSCHVYPLRSASIILPLHCLTKPILAYYYLLAGWGKGRCKPQLHFFFFFFLLKPCTYLCRTRTP